MLAQGSASIAWNDSPRRLSSRRTGSTIRQAPTSVATATRRAVMTKPLSRCGERGRGQQSRSRRDVLRDVDPGQVELLGPVAADPVAGGVLPPLRVLRLAAIDGE